MTASGVNYSSVLANQIRTGHPLAAQGRKFLTSTTAAGSDAAKLATNKSREVFTSKLNPRGRPLAPARAGRPTTEGKFADHIQWEYNTAKDRVYFNIEKMDEAALYWTIQEVGTNKSAYVYDSEIGPFTIDIKSQVGRRISSNLVWADSLGGVATRGITGANGQQLFYRSQSLVNNLRRRKLRINREIKGKHFLHAGAKSGWEFYRKELTKAFHGYSK